MNDYFFNQEQEVKKQDPLHSVLDSFYSDIAAMETPTSGEGSQEPVMVEEINKTSENCSLEAIADNTKKKKKKVSFKQEYDSLKTENNIITN